MFIYEFVYRGFFWLKKFKNQLILKFQLNLESKDSTDVALSFSLETVEYEKNVCDFVWM